MKTHLQRISRRGLFWLFLQTAIAVPASSGVAQQTLCPADPIGFFTNVAGRLLRSELNVDLAHIQIYPTNFYSPELHRLLQVTANIYDATTNRGDSHPFYPTVFRPIFGTNGSEIFIAGYAEETGTNLIYRPWHDLKNLDERAIAPDDNIYGVPLIIGARKGYPNFNKFCLQTYVTFVRKLEFRKTNSTDRLPCQTNQMLILGISNICAVQTWNSYSSPFPRDLEILVGSRTSVAFTNDDGLQFMTNFVGGTRTTVSTNSSPWSGFQVGHFDPANLRITLLTNQLALSSSVYYRTRNGTFDPHLEPIGPVQSFETNQLLCPNAWGLKVSTRLIFFLVDSGHIVDAFSSADLDADFPISDELNSPLPGASSPEVAGLWDITPVGSGTVGTVNQFVVSLSKNLSSDADWRNYSANSIAPIDKERAIDNFRVFLGLPPQTYSSNSLTGYLSNVIEAPFVPVRKMVKTARWEANDPLVHSSTNQLVIVNLGPVTISPQVSMFNKMELQQINICYRPWGGNPWQETGWDSTSYDPAVKDPLIWSSDCWDFPEAQPDLLGCLGRIHRGTPWQTIYLKATSCFASSWLYPSGPSTTLSNHPTNDWKLVSLLARLLNTNDPRALLSINETNLAPWGKVLDGVTVVSNAPQWNCISLTMLSNSPQAQMIVDAINLLRSRQPGQVFRDLGDIFATPELSTRSPWVNWHNDELPFDCMDDPAYEAIPAQILPRLRADPVARIRRISGQLEIQWQGFAGYSYAIQVSSDLRNWDTLTTVGSSDIDFTFMDTAALGPTRRFYRATLFP